MFFDYIMLVLNEQHETHTETMVAMLTRRTTCSSSERHKEEWRQARDGGGVWGCFGQANGVGSDGEINEQMDRKDDTAQMCEAVV